MIEHVFTGCDNYSDEQSHDCRWSHADDLDSWCRYCLVDEVDRMHERLRGRSAYLDWLVNEVCPSHNIDCVQVGCPATPPGTVSRIEKLTTARSRRPDPDEVVSRHTYRRDSQSGAGNCWCGRHEGHRMHQWSDPRDIRLTDGT